MKTITRRLDAPCEYNLAFMESECFAAVVKPTDIVKKSVPMPPLLWRQIEARLNCYDPPLKFVDWARRVFQKELKDPPRLLGDWSAQPKEQTK